MPMMSSIERAFCRSAPWQFFARSIVLPWALDGYRLEGEVLEVGGGGGAMAAGVARAHPGARITVTDLDPAMVDAATSRLAMQPAVVVQKADFISLPFDPAQFDVVISYLMLHHVIDWNGALVEVARVLKPGGVFLGYDLTNTRMARLVHRVDGSPHRLIDHEELAGRLAEARFSEIVVWPATYQHVMRFRANLPIG